MKQLLNGKSQLTVPFGLFLLPFGLPRGLLWGGSPESGSLCRDVEERVGSEDGLSRGEPCSEAVTLNERLEGPFRRLAVR